MDPVSGRVLRRPVAVFHLVGEWITSKILFGRTGFPTKTTRWKRMEKVNPFVGGKLAKACDVFVEVRVME